MLARNESARQRAMFEPRIPPGSGIKSADVFLNPKVCFRPSIQGLYELEQPSAFKC